MQKYVDFAVEKTVEVLAIDSPTGFTDGAARWLADEIASLGFDARITEKGGVLGDYAGKFATCFQVENLEEALAKHAANGFAQYAEIAEYELAPYGKVRSALVHGPSKALMELYEIVK